MPAPTGVAAIPCQRTQHESCICADHVPHLAGLRDRSDALRPVRRAAGMTERLDFFSATPVDRAFNARRRQEPSRSRLRDAAQRLAIAAFVAPLRAGTRSA